MKVSKAQAQANRAHIVETAAVLFRERGYDGVSLADLMGAAGFTHGGFYKHFRSKADLMTEAAAVSFAQMQDRVQTNAARAEREAGIQQYLSRAHRDTPGEGCTFAALSADAARQPEHVKQVFAEGIESLLAAAMQAVAELGQDAQSEARAARIDSMAQLVGAIMLSRACPDDSPLADEILEACRRAALARLPQG